MASGPQAELRSYTFLFFFLAIMPPKYDAKPASKTYKQDIKLFMFIPVNHPPVNELSTFYAAGAVWEAGFNEPGKKTDARKLHSHLRFYK